jgi:hypothetical protein
MKNTTARLCRITAAASVLVLVVASATAAGAGAKPGSMGSMDVAPLKDADSSCKSACLEDLMQKYFNALAARNPSAAPVTADD